MTGNEKLKPSVQLYDYLERGKPPDSPAVESWARLHIYRAAQWVLSASTREDRRERLIMTPEHIRERVEDECKRIWKFQKWKQNEAQNQETTP